MKVPKFKNLRWLAYHDLILFGIIFVYPCYFIKDSTIQFAGVLWVNFVVGIWVMFKLYLIVCTAARCYKVYRLKKMCLPVTSVLLGVYKEYLGLYELCLGRGFYLVCEYRGRQFKSYGMNEEDAQKLGEQLARVKEVKILIDFEKSARYYIDFKSLLQEHS